jgi:hypothetical protein
VFIRVNSRRKLLIFAFNRTQIKREAGAVYLHHIEYVPEESRMSTNDATKQSTGEDDTYQEAQRRALALLETGFHSGGRIESTRDEWHERRVLSGM